MGNSFGIIFKLTTFGESHGAAIGGVVDGVPAGLQISTDAIQQALDRRRPGAGGASTTRRESDRVTLLSGVFEGMTLGTPIGFVIENTNSRSEDYGQLRELYRPSHADYTYDAKYGFRDYRGGGRASARETACRVVGGAIAEQILATRGIAVDAYALRIGNLRLPEQADQVDDLILRLRREGDTIGGIVGCRISGLPAGLGDPVFDKLQARLAYAMMSIPAAKGFDYGTGFDSAEMRGSEANDRFTTDSSGNIVTTSNNSGGIQGGITNGMDIYLRVAFKPIATIMQPQLTVSRDGSPATLGPRGRHDVCALPRAIPVVRAMAAMTVADAMLLNRSSRI